MSIETVSSQIVRLTVVGNGKLRLNKTDPLQRHQFGMSNAPLFTLQQPFASDDGWEISCNPKGEYISSNDLKNAESFPSWITSKANAAIIDLLPSGVYWIVRSLLQPVEAEFIFVGNEAVRAKPCMRILLRDAGPVDAILFGSPEQTPPRLDQLLIGVVICHQTGYRFPVGSEERGQHQLVFFSFGDGTHPHGDSSDDLVLIIPDSGEFIVDNLQRSTANTQVYIPVQEDLTYKQVWTDCFARQVAEQFAGR